MKLRFQRGPVDSLETLHPAYFALVMATGIVALAAQLHQLPLVAEVLFWLNGCLLAVLVLATALRLVRYPRAFAADVRSHSRGVGFFTSVAAFGVFGAQLVVQMHAARLAVAFLLITALLWLLITYGVLAVLTIKRDKPGVAAGLNGGWLVSVVATQSVSILIILTLSTGALEDFRAPLAFAALTLWLGGGALYLWLMAIIFYRYTFVRMLPEDLTPPYWISMGAVAISTLAGTTLLEQATLSPLIAQLKPFIEGFTLFFWAAGTWWIPMLVVLGVWRYLVRGVPFSYDPLYWGCVFPLGMYAVCTFHLAHALNTPFLLPLSDLFTLLALAAWLTAFVGLVDSLSRAGSRTAKHPCNEARR